MAENQKLIKDVHFLNRDNVHFHQSNAQLRKDKKELEKKLEAIISLAGNNNNNNRNGSRNTSATDVRTGDPSLKSSTACTHNTTLTDSNDDKFSVYCAVNALLISQHLASLLQPNTIQLSNKVTHIRYQTESSVMKPINILSNVKQYTCDLCFIAVPSHKIKDIIYSPVTSNQLLTKVLCNKISVKKEDYFIVEFQSNFWTNNIPFDTCQLKMIFNDQYSFSQWKCSYYDNQSNINWIFADHSLIPCQMIFNKHQNDNIIVLIIDDTLQKYLQSRVSNTCTLINVLIYEMIRVLGCMFGQQNVSNIRYSYLTGIGSDIFGRSAQYYNKTAFPVLNKETLPLYVNIFMSIIIYLLYFIVCIL